eukprot:TRINITY_DN2661_c0_g1_i1.p1 TRINITY_DN2661_c0_g1~~TRINITY_DN2661_c0_g1_i1.p1  ORF type:complete len:125 (-),score=20.05 TRINITY_DN2661_c0_g1_i1:170-544(-)
MEDLDRLYQKFHAQVAFLGVYIVEAHAVDEWPVGDPLSITQPISDAERCGVAREFVRYYKPQYEMVVDKVTNEFSRKYSAWPIRFYVIDQKGSILFKGQPDDKNTYDSVPRQLTSVFDNLLQVS